VCPAILRRIRNADSQKKRKRRVIRENALECGFGFKNPGMCGKRKSFQREERGWEAQREKEFWIGCRTHFGAVLVRRTPAAVCHKDPCPLQYFFAVWGRAGRLWPPTHAILPSPLHSLADAPGSVLRSLGCGGKGDLMANLEGGLYLDPCLLCSCSNLRQVG
jgi:hypothetical protein